MIDTALLPHLGRARDVAYRAYAQPLDLDELAQAACVSRPYGVEAIFRDNSGNWLVLVERKPYGRS